MNYYKIISNNSFIGVVHSGYFTWESPRNHRLFAEDESISQYIDYQGILYRDYWMSPVISDRPFTQATITKITKEEYDIYMNAEKNNTPIEEEEEEEIDETVPPLFPPEPDIDLEYIRASKIAEMSTACRRTIEGGFDLELRGKKYHFSLDTQDQLNLMSLSVMAQTQSLIPYHADGEPCVFYTNEEINEIVDTANAFKIYHTTYYNALKGYINALEIIEDIAAIEYGTPIPEEYKSDVLKALE